jgi:AraC-like DNA-binding protein
LFTFEYQHDDYSLFIREFAAALGVQLTDDDTLVMPEAMASGYYRMVTLPNGLQVNLINCTLNCNWYLHRKPAEHEYYTLRFDEFTIPGNLVMTIDDNSLTEKQTERSFIYLTSSLFDFSYMGAKGTKIRGVNVLLKPEYISKYMGLDSADDMLRNYIALKAESHNAEQVDMDYKQLMNEILYPDPAKPFPRLAMLNRLQLLIEKFFTKLHHLSSRQPLNLRLGNAEINRIMQAERILTGDFSGKPPSIPQLAKSSAMSVSTFKTNFKLVYGSPVYAYYQAKRLQSARELLISGRYNVKEAGEAVAYDNTSNFITAFKKQFNISPGALLNN